MVFLTGRSQVAESHGCYIWTNSVLDPGVIPEIKGVTKWVEMTLISLIELFNPTVW